MLDFYLIPDHQPKPNSFNALEFIGGIEEKAFDELQNIEVIDKHYDYYSDFRLSNAVIKQKLDLINQYGLNNSLNISKFLEILENANRNGVGLIARGD
jgi:hypothetical protein